MTNGGAPYALAVDAPTNRLIVIAGRRTCTFDAATLAIVGCVVSGDPYAVSVSDDGSRVYVLDQVSPSSLLTLDGHSGKLLASIHLGDALPWAVAADRDGALVSLGGDVALIEGARLRSPAHIGSTSRSILVDFRSRHAFVLDPADGTVAVLDATLGKLLSVVRVGTLPSAAALDSMRGRVYVANQGSDTVSVLSASTGRVVRAVHVGTQPVAVAVDERLGLVVVVNGGVPETDHSGSITIFKAS